MTAWLGHLGTLALQATSHIGPQALVALLAVALLTEIGIPFPGVMDSVLFLIGYRLVHPWVQSVLVPLSLLVGRQLGSAFVFWTARTVSRPIKKQLGDQFSLETIGQSLASNGNHKWVIFALVARLGSKVSRTSRLNLTSHPPLAIVLGRITLGLLTACSVACGILDVRYPYFAAGVAMSSLLADGALIALGVIASTVSTLFGVVVPILWLVLSAIAVNILLILFLGRWLLKPRRS